MLMLMHYNYYLLYMQVDDNPIPEVTAEHPDVAKAIAAAVEKVNNSPVEITQEMYMEALKNGIESAHQKRREENPDGPRLEVVVSFVLNI